MKRENLFKIFEILCYGNYMETRILNTKKGTISGYFNNEESLERAIMRYDGKNNIFFTLNEISENIVSRSKDHLTMFAKHTTKDSEIIRRRWIPVDFDPVRPAGVSSTDEELGYAKQLFEEVKDYFLSQGITGMVYAMSGNGYHILIPVDLPNDDKSTKLVKEFLKSLDKKFSTAQVKVDTSTYNAARIIKLYGTVACKGDNTEERPHRRSYIIGIPDTIEPASETLLRKISDMEEESVMEEKEISKQRVTLPVREYLETHGIEISHEKPWGAGGICFVLKTCPWNHDHTDNSAYVIQLPNGKVVAGCHHNSCQGENWETLLKKYPDSRMQTKRRTSKTSKRDEDRLNIPEILLRDIEDEGHCFYYDLSENAYVSIEQEGHREYLAVQDRGYQQQLRYLFYQKYDKTLNKDSLKQVLDTLEVKALHEGKEIEPAYRCKYLNGKLYYFLADKEQSVICIEKDGYHFLDNSFVPFIKKRAMAEQVVPLKSKKLFRKLAVKHWKFLTKEDRILHHVLLITRLITDIPMPIVYYQGDRGASKTTAMKMDKMLIDPSTADVKALPRSINDVVSALSGQYMVCFDNINQIPNDLANIFCICATNGTYGKRKLYSDNDETLIKLNARLGFTGITTISSQPDLLDRTVCIKFARIEGTKRKTMEEVMDNFKKDVPFMLDRIFIILSKAIEIYETLELNGLPRMADFAKWGYAVAEAMNYGGETFLKIYEENQNELLETMVEEDSLTHVLIEFIQQHGHFEGSMTELLVGLTREAESMEISTKNGWVKDASVLSRKLFETQSVLSIFHIHMKRGKKNGERFVELWLESPDERDE